MAYNASVQLMRRKNPATGKPSEEAYCVTCGTMVGWFRPEGCSVWCGVVAMSDAVQTVREEIKNAAGNPTGTFRVIITKIQPSAQLHGGTACGVPAGENLNKYSRRFDMARSGQMPNAAPVPPGTVPTPRTPRVRRPRVAQPAPAAPAIVNTSGTIPHASMGNVAKATVTVPAKPARPIPQIPPNGQREWKRAAKAIEYAHATPRMLLYGPPATGKTTLAHKHAEKNGCGIYSVTLSEEAGAEILKGQFIVEGGDVRWHDGPATRAFRESHKRFTFLILNEVDHASGDAMTALHEILDDPSIAALYLPTNEIVRPKAGNLCIIGTTNADAQTAGFAVGVASRFAVKIPLAYPNPESIASRHTHYAKMLMAAANREHDLRQIIAWDDLMRAGLDVQEAAEIVFDEAVAKSIVDAYKLNEGK